MGRGGKVGSKPHSRRRIHRGSDESDGDYTMGDDEEFNDSEEYGSSFVAEESQESLGEFEEDEEGRKVSRSTGQKALPGRKRNRVRNSHKIRKVSYKVEDNEDFEVEDLDDDDVEEFDQNGRQCLTMEGYGEIGRQFRCLADKHSNGRLLIVQEGGYNLTYSVYCVHATLEGALNLQLPLLSDPIAYYPEDVAFATEVIGSIKRYQKRM